MTKFESKISPILINWLQFQLKWKILKDKKNKLALFGSKSYLSGSQWRVNALVYSCSAWITKLKKYQTDTLPKFQTPNVLIKCLILSIHLNAMPCKLDSFLNISTETFECNCLQMYLQSSFISLFAELRSNISTFIRARTRFLKKFKLGSKLFFPPDWLKNVLCLSEAKKNCAWDGEKNGDVRLLPLWVAFARRCHFQMASQL